MNFNFHVVIPARYQSTRLPGKLMMEIDGKTVLQRVYEQALQAQPKTITIATDNEQIATHAREFGAHVEMTLPSHATGTDRIAEVIARGFYTENDIIVNVQGDEPFIEPALINQVARILTNRELNMATLCWPIEKQEQLLNPNVVKVVRDRFNNALYFSRSPIPCNRDEPNSISHVFRHIGLYAYRAKFLVDFVSWLPCKLEISECLEQLRALWAGHKIRVDVACAVPQQDINTADDLEKARKEALTKNY
ncbi:3-deoxy-manno-octulosonate cytidylyltransferase [Legionella busanensis]|uniref:3-deoxy-manno-octulosonate cytidylyltransferase n=1 Tax=Legionella busanensis TaxID=190655 RepID=A0A378JMM0_9GAMM|nr:3-deoxy-manno-octulosonate cytidylyltransferase [Legionella busanensis]STX51938.1 3-deoxy-manno-octulosonate cytidylyltransferase [Legionella busanensis]